MSLHFFPRYQQEFKNIYKAWRISTTLSHFCVQVYELLYTFQFSFSAFFFSFFVTRQNFKLYFSLKYTELLMLAVIVLSGWYTLLYNRPLGITDTLHEHFNFLPLLYIQWVTFNIYYSPGARDRPSNEQTETAKQGYCLLWLWEPAYRPWSITSELWHSSKGRVA